MFSDALRVVWQAVFGIASAGFVSSVGMRQLQLHTNIDQDWGREDIPGPIERKPSTSPEMLPIILLLARIFFLTFDFWLVLRSQWIQRRKEQPLHVGMSRLIRLGFDPIDFRNSRTHTHIYWRVISLC